MFVRWLSFAAALCLLAVGSGAAWAAPTATVRLDADVSGCESGRLLIATSGISGGREFRRATWSDGVRTDVLLGQNEGAGPESGYAGALDFAFPAGPVPYGIAVTLYGYQGSTPPDPATTVEFAVTYVCETQEILASGAGPYGTITKGPAVEVAPVRIPAVSPSALLALAVLLGFAGGAALRCRRG